MDIFRYAGLREGAGLIDDRNPQGKSMAELQGIIEAREADKAQYQEYLNTWGKENGVTLMKHATTTWREESLLKAGYDQLVDLSQDYDSTYDPGQEEIPEDWPKAYQEALLDAVNPQHFQRLKNRYQDQVDYNLEAEYLGGTGTAASIAAMIVHPESALLGVAEAALLSKMALKSGVQRFAAGASIGALSNVGQEMAIIANNKSRDKMGAIIAGATGAAFGGAVSVFGKLDPEIEMTKARKILGDEYSRAVKQDLDLSTQPELWPGTDDVSALYNGMVQGRILQDPGTGKWVVSLRGTAAEYPSKAQALSAYRKLEDTGYYEPRKAATAESTQTDIPEAPAEPKLQLGQNMADEIDKDLPRQKKVTGKLASMGLQGMSSKNPFERLLTWLTVEFAPGTGGRQVASQSAALTADMYTHQMRSVFHPERLTALKNWKRTNNIRSMPWDDSAGDIFDREVATELAYRVYPKTRPQGAAVDIDVGRVANAYENVERMRFDLQKTNGVKGYEGLDADPLHFSHRWDATRMTRIANQTSPEFVISVLKKGILAGKEFSRKHKYKKFGDRLTDQFKDDRAGFMAKAIYERFTRRPDTVNLARASYIRVKDRKILDQRLQEAIDDPNVLEHIMTSVDGKDSRVLNEYFKQIEMNLNAEVDGTRVMDLLDANLGRNMDTQFRRAGGRAAMARKGFKDESDFMDAAEQAGVWWRNNTDMTAEQRAKEVTRVQNLWKVAMAENIEADPASSLSRFLRGTRRLATLSAMNQVGFAQAAEFGRVTGALGVKMFMKQIPALAHMRRNMLNGKFSDEILNDIEAAFDIRLGDNHLLHHPLIMADSGGYGISTEGSNAILRGIDTLSMKAMHVQGYINGMNQITRMQQRMHARGFFMRMHEDLMKGQRLERYADLGLGPEDLKLIRREFETKATTKAGWTGKERLQNLNLQSMKPELAEKLGLAFHKAQSNAVQRNLGGETAWWMESSFGKLMSQFRTFPLVALEKQTIHDLKFMDTEAFTSMIASFGFATMAYMAKTYVNSFGLDKKKRKQYLKNRIGTPDRIAAGASRWMGQASLAPDFAELLLPYGTHNPFRYSDYKGTAFRQHTEDLGIDLLGPGPSMLNSAYRASHGIGMAMLNGEELTDSTFRHAKRLWVYNNAIGFTNAFNYLGR